MCFPPPARTERYARRRPPSIHPATRYPHRLHKRDARQACFGMIAVPEGPVPPLTAARMAARYAALEAKGNQGAIGRMDNARRIFQREEFRCLKAGQLSELDALRRSQFVHNPSRRAVGG